MTSNTPWAYRLNRVEQAIDDAGFVTGDVSVEFESSQLLTTITADLFKIVGETKGIPEAAEEIDVADARGRLWDILEDASFKVMAFDAAETHDDDDEFATLRIHVELGDRKRIDAYKDDE